ncbi:putative protein [BD1-7 clade bacterium]|uniref:AB hydrolase-1 domain-containing protein n=1 Tax=BD1-7 clade bacterium TaxID=2029982 RepID=A0A5S9NXY9_9GAMM|nr:putative protein [BD1-7 clade bacterium]
MIQETHTFRSLGSGCEADLFLPKPDGQFPIVVMGQGLGSERQFGDKNLIEALVNAGIAVFAFDYRGFGGSEEILKQPRQMIDPDCQIEDWQSALKYVATLTKVDPARLVIWGSSFGGGHALTVAAAAWAKAYKIKAVVAQVPHCDSRSAFKHAGLKTALTGVGNGLKDLFGSRFGKTHTVPLVSADGDDTFAVLKHPGWYDGYMRIAAGSATWQNAIPAASLLKIGTYNPIDTVEQINCPVLIVYGKNDPGVLPSDVERAADMITHVERFCFDGDHFDVYDGGPLNAVAIEREVSFISRYLLGD